MESDVNPGSFDLFSYSWQHCRQQEQGPLMSEVVVEHHVQCSRPLYGHVLLCVLSTMLEVNCTLFDNMVLAGSATDTLCQ